MPNATIKILLAISGTEQRKELARVLSPRFQVSEVSSLAELQSSWVRQAPNMILLDPDLPDGDGIAWVASVRQELLNRKIKVVVVTNRSTVRDKMRGFRAGVDDYLVYPINGDLLPHRLILLRQVVRTFDRS